jgi:hypothetical protein
MDPEEQSGLLASTTASAEILASTKVFVEQMAHQISWFRLTFLVLAVYSANMEGCYSQRAILFPPVPILT